MNINMQVINFLLSKIYFVIGFINVYVCLKIYKMDFFYFSYIIISIFCYIIWVFVGDDSLLNVNKYNSWIQLCNIECMMKVENILFYCISIKVYKIQK